MVSKERHHRIHMVSKERQHRITTLRAYREGLFILSSLIFFIEIRLIWLARLLVLKVISDKL